MMALKFFAVLAGVVGTGMWLLAFWALDDAVTNEYRSAPAFTQGLSYGFFLWITAVVLYAFSDVIGYLKVIAENSESWAEED
jgi:hypothetical protein